ncbi:ATP dependent DNA ligase C terminal region [Bradyrhizobium arachidis]|nr:ATP dependent DNA ligase C terminal region [Bradyrhizobium arachidis]
MQRKTELKKIINGTEIQFSESFEIEGREVFEHACKIGLEGVVPEDTAVREADRPQGHLVEPKLLAEVEYRAKSAEGKVRHPFFKGLREDMQ